jgi:hypothetical protein
VPFTQQQSLATMWMNRMPYDTLDDAGYSAYAVETTILEIMVNAADSNRFSGKSGNHSQRSRRIVG